MAAKPGQPPNADSWPIDDEWKARVEAKRRAQRIPKKEVAARIGTTPGNVVRILLPIPQGGYRRSSHARAIAKMFAEPLPLSGDLQADDVRVLADELLLLSPAAFHEYVQELKHRVQLLRRAVKSVRSKKIR